MRANSVDSYKGPVSPGPTLRDVTDHRNPRLASSLETHLWPSVTSPSSALSQPTLVPTPHTPEPREWLPEGLEHT